MRISDWSSDVCSSDLPVADPRRAAAWRCLRRGGQKDGLCGVRPFLQSDADPSEQHRLQCPPPGPDAPCSGARHARGADPDRKSVVEGKRGAVRVDLGGRRFIKKKKKPNKYECTIMKPKIE